MRWWDDAMMRWWDDKMLGLWWCSGGVGSQMRWWDDKILSLWWCWGGVGPQKGCWSPQGPQNDPKMVPKWSPSGPQMVPTWSPNGPKGGRRCLLEAVFSDATLQTRDLKRRPSFLTPKVPHRPPKSLPKWFQNWIENHQKTNKNLGTDFDRFEGRCLMILDARMKHLFVKNGR